MENYLQLSRKYQEDFGKLTIVLMQCGDFFEVYATLPLSECIVPIQEYSRMTDLAIANKYIKGNSSTKYVMAGFKLPYLERYLKILISNGYTIPVFTQDPLDPKKRTCEVFSEGRILDDIGTNNNNYQHYLACIWFEQLNYGSTKTALIERKSWEIGFVALDMLSGQVIANEYSLSELNAVSLEELESNIRVCAPQEICLLLSRDMEDKRKEIIQALGLGLTGKLHESGSETKMTNAKKQTYQQEILSRYYPHKDKELNYAEFYPYPCATQTFCYLLDFVFGAEDSIPISLQEVTWEKSRKSLYLGNHSLKQLEILATEQGKGLFGFMNQCQSPMGKRHFQEVFFHPITDKNQLEKEYQQTQELLASEDCKFWKEFSNLPDLSKQVSAILRGKYPLEKMFSFIQGIHLSVKIQKECLQLQLFQHSKEWFSNGHQIELDIETTPLLDFLEKYFDEKGDLRPNTEMQECHRKRDCATQQLRQFCDELESKFPKTMKSSNTDSIKIHQTEKNIVLRMTNTRAKILEEAIQFTDLAKGLTFEKDTKTEKSLSSPQLSLWIQEILNANSQLDEIVHLHYQSLLQNLAAEFYPTLKKLIYQLGVIDTAFCKAYLAKKYHYCRPSFFSDDDNDDNNNNNGFKVIGLRHPLIETQPCTSEVYVANDLDMVSPESVLLLYGTNAVGKTSFIKSVGLAVYLAQIGMFVPATSFQFRPFHAIYTRILAQDNLYQGLSTFAVEMLELKNILRNANKHTLVIGDELCAGTETPSAASIFTAGIQVLVEKGATCLFSTHLHEITKFPEILDLYPKVRMKHLSVVYDRAQEQLIYYRTLKDNPGSPMYGLEFCYSLGFPTSFLEKVETLRSHYYPTSILDQSTSHYHKDKLKGGLCEKCGLFPSTEIHHLEPQKNNPLYKNHPANLINVCERCHQHVFHPTGTQQTVAYKKIKTVRTTSRSALLYCPAGNTHKL